MTIDEVINRYEEVAEEQEKQANTNIIGIEEDGTMLLYDGKEYQSCMDCAAEHRQLAEWLRELKAYRIATYKLSRLPYGEFLEYKSDDVWDLFGNLWTAEIEDEVMGYEEVYH